MHKEAPVPGTCPNCGEPVSQNFCPNCGQENTPMLLPVSHLLQDVADEFIKLDSKFFRTLGPLLVRPGFLTNEFIAGRRVRYVSPFRLYFLISALYFVAFSFAHYDVAIMHGLAYGLEQAHHAHLAHKSGLAVMSAMLSPAPHMHSATHHAMAMAHGSEDHDGMESDSHMAMTHSAESHEANNSGKASLDPDAERAQRHALAVNRTSRWFLMNQSLITFLLVPIAALLLKLLYIKTGRLYVEHLVFAVNLQSFMFAILLPALLPYARSQTYILAFALSGVYLFFAMRNVYRQSVFATLTRCGLMLASYALIMVAIAYTAFLTFYNLS